jgi:hypothetical protein
MRKIVVGDLTVVQSCTLILKDDEVARLEFSIQEGQQIGAETLKLQFRFTERHSAKPTATWRTENDTVSFELRGWKFGAGASLDGPVAFGDLNGAKLWFDMVHNTIGPTNVAHIVILLGG